MRTFRDMYSAEEPSTLKQEDRQLLDNAFSRLLSELNGASLNTINLSSEF
jgi:RNA polymerase-interacting CarD/CdnL/TRCF family regulator